MNSIESSEFAGMPAASSFDGAPNFQTASLSPTFVVPSQSAPEPIEEISVVENVEAAPVADPAPIKAAMNAVTSSFVTRQEFEEMKDSINSSFEEAANMILELQSANQMFEERIVAYNARSSHKI